MRAGVLTRSSGANEQSILVRSASLRLCVKVLPSSVLPADDVGIDPIATRLSVGAERDDVWRIAMIPWKLVDVIVLPRVLRQFLLRVRASPLRRIGWFGS